MHRGGKSWKGVCVFMQNSTRVPVSEVVVALVTDFEGYAALMCKRKNAAKECLPPVVYSKETNNDSWFVFAYCSSMKRRDEILQRPARTAQIGRVLRSSSYLHGSATTCAVFEDWHVDAHESAKGATYDWRLAGLVRLLVASFGAPGEKLWDLTPCSWVDDEYDLEARGAATIASPDVALAALSIGMAYSCYIPESGMKNSTATKINLLAALRDADWVAREYMLKDEHTPLALQELGLGQVEAHPLMSFLGCVYACVLLWRGTNFVCVCAGQCHVRTVPCCVRCRLQLSLHEVLAAIPLLS